MEQFEYIETDALSIRARSKKEMYDFLISKGGIKLKKIQD